MLVGMKTAAPLLASKASVVVLQPQSTTPVQEKSMRREQAIGTTGPVCLSIFGGSEVSQVPSGHSLKKLALKKPDVSHANSTSQVFYPEATQSQAYNQGDNYEASGVTQIKCRKMLGDSDFRRFASWELPGAKLANYSRQGFVPLHHGQIVRMGGLTLMGVTTEELADVVERYRKNSLFAVDMLLVGGLLDESHSVELMRLLWLIKPSFAFVQAPKSGPANWFHRKTEVIQLDESKEKYGLIDFEPQSEHLSVRFYDRVVGEPSYHQMVNLQKHRRMQLRLELSQERFINQLTQELRSMPEFGVLGDAEVRAGMAINGVLTLASDYITAREKNPYRPITVEQEELAGVQSTLNQMLFNKWKHGEVNEALVNLLMDDQGQAFEVILRAWGMLPT